MSVNLDPGGPSMPVWRSRSGRDALVFVLLTPFLIFLSIRLEQVDPRVPGKFSFLVLLVPTLLVGLTGRRWQGLTTALIAGMGCLVAGWLGAWAQPKVASAAGIGMPVLLGGALLSIGALLTLRCDEVQQRVGNLETAVSRIVATDSLEDLADAI